MKKLMKSGFEVIVEKGAGIAANYNDDEYSDAGATISDRASVLSCEIIISIRIPDASELSKGQIVACVADPFRHPEKVQACIDGGITLMSMDMIPRRLSRAQSMDVNSSQDNLAGYKAVIIPKINLKDIVLSKDVLKKIRIIPVEKVWEVVEHALVDGKKIAKKMK